MIVLVPTYRRPELFARLCGDLRREMRQGDALFVVHDDQPDRYVFETIQSAGLGLQAMHITQPHEGKRGYWRTVNELLDCTMSAPPEMPVAYLADDLRLAEGWRDDVLEWLDVAEDFDGCIGLHAHRDVRTSEWGLPGGEDIGPGERMAWQDGAWVTRVRWIDAMRPREVSRPWDKRPMLGSGAWRSSSYRTHEAGLWWLRPKARLCWHDDGGVSVMNPLTTQGEARRIARRVYTEGE